MKKIIMNVVALIILIAIITSVYIFVKDRQIKKGLNGVEQSEFVDGNQSDQALVVDSEISLIRTGGQWSVSENGEYTIDPNSIVFTFTGYKVGGEHTGTFNDIKSAIALDAQGQPIALGMVLAPASIKTDAEGVDKHLQDKVFFDTVTYSDVQVVVKNIEKTSTSTKAITDITIKGITKTIAIPVTFAQVEGGTKFSIDTKIKISQWDMAFGPVQDDVRVVLSAVLKKK